MNGSVLSLQVEVGGDTGAGVGAGVGAEVGAGVGAEVGAGVGRADIILATSNPDMYAPTSKIRRENVRR